jgi:hypothetical protein
MTLLLKAIGISSALGSVAAMAAAPLQQSEKPVADFTFASQLGSGIYSVSGRIVQVYQLPVEWELSPPTDTELGVKLLLPVTLGFYNFRVEDLVTAGLPSRVDTLSVAPGVEVSWLVGRYWRLAASGEVGASLVSGGTGNSLIYAGEFSAEGTRTVQEFRFRYRAAVLYAGADSKDLPSDSMWRVSNGVEMRHNLNAVAWGARLDWGLYAFNEWYLKPPDPPLNAAGPSIVPLQWEAGMTFGTALPAKIYGIPVPRIGIGYRFGNNLGIARIVLGAAF